MTVPEGSNLVRYGSYEEAAADQEKQAMQGDFMTLSVGRNVIRILPPKAGVRSPFFVVHEHYIEMTGRDAVKFTCPRMHAKRHCIACAKAEELRATGNQVDRDRAGSLFPRKRIYTNVLDRNAQEQGPKILPFGKTIHEKLIAIRKDPDAGGDFTHPMTGFDIIIERTGTGKRDTRYEVFGARRASKLSDDIETMNGWIDLQPDLTHFAVVKTDDEIRAMFGGQPSGGGGGERRARTAQDDAATVDAEYTRKDGAAAGSASDEDVPF